MSCHVISYHICSFLTHIAAGVTNPAQKMLMAGAAANENVFRGRNYTFSTTCPSTLYIETVFRSLKQFSAPRVAVLRDIDEPICLPDIVTSVSATSPVEVYGQFEFDPEAIDYDEQILVVMQELQANGVESILGCSYEKLCINVSTLVNVTQFLSCT